MSSMMVLKHNARTGVDEWAVVEPGSADADAGESSLVAASSYLDMLTDRKRNKAYRVALEYVLSKQDASCMHNNKAPNCLDIGTGTGLLAIMAGQVLRAQRQQAGVPLSGETPVVACELFPTMTQVAKKVVAANGYQNEVAVIEKRSDDLLVQSEESPNFDHISKGEHRRMAVTGSTPKPDMGGKVGVIVTEIFDSALLGEGLLPSMRHAKQHLLKEGGCVIPGRATVWAQLVECPAMRQWAGPVASGAKGASSTHGARSADSDPNRSSDHTAASNVRPQLCSSTHGSGLPASQAQRVLQLLTDLDAAAVESELQGRPCSGSLGAACGSGSEDGSAGGGYASDSEGSGLDGSEGGSALGSSEKGERSQGPVCCWHDLHELHMDVVQNQVVPLSAPISVLDFDLSDPPPGDQVKHGVEVPITHSAVADGVVLWWQLDMVPQEKWQSPAEQPQASSMTRPEPLFLSTAPCWVGSGPGCGGDGGPLHGVHQEWRGHWAQCWAKLGGNKGLQVVQGGELALSVRHDDLGIQIGLTPRNPSQPTEPASAADALNSTAAPSAAAASDVSASASAAAPAGGASGATGGSGGQSDWPTAVPQSVLPSLRAWLPPPSMQQLNGPGGRWDTFEACLKAILLDCVRSHRKTASNNTSAPTTHGISPPSTPAQSSVPSPIEAVCVGTGLISPDQLIPPLLLCACAREVAEAEGVDIKITALADHGAAQRWLTVAGEALLAENQAPLTDDHARLAGSSHATTNQAGGQASTQFMRDSQRGHVTLSVHPESKYMERAKKVHRSLSAQRPDGQQGSSQQSNHLSAPVTLIVGDPSYHQGKGAAACTHLLQFWSDVDVIRKAEVAKGRQVVCFPERAMLRAVAASLPHLDRTRQSLHMVEGVDLSAANSVLGGDGQIELSLGVPWQCGGEYTEVGPREDLLTIDLASEPFSSPVHGSVQLHAHAPSSAAAAAPGVHGVVVWADYVLPVSSHQSHAREKPAASAQIGGLGGAGRSCVIQDGPSPQAYTATQTVLLLPQQQRCVQLQGEQQLRVAVSLEDHGFSLVAERMGC